MRVVLAATIAGALCLSACTSKKASPTQTNSPVPAKPAVKPIDPATAAIVSGVVSFEGAAPKPVSIDMSQDPACGSSRVDSDSLVVNNGHLANVFVYVKDGLGDRGFDVPGTPVVVDQAGCRYHPHVAGAMVGQPVRFINSDTTAHNVHPMPQRNRQWNESQMPHSDPLTRTFNQPEIMVPVKCNQHPWMKMYLNLVSNPFFAVTDGAGRFELKGLPPGTYTIAAVQEKLGEKTVQVTVGPKQSGSANFTFQNGPADSAGR